MYGIFMESVVIFKNYAGEGFLLLLFLLSLGYLFFAEKDKKLRAVFVWLPLAVLFLFFFPLYRKVYVRLMGEGTTYYRMLWLIPMGVIIAYAGMKLSARLQERKNAWYRRAALLLLCAAVIFCGKYVYASQYMSKAENLYHLPQNVVDICDLIAPKEGEERVWAVFPTELVYFVRQYDSNIQLAYGREFVEPVWGYYDEVHEVMNHPTTIDLEKLLSLSRERYCTYIVLPNNKEVSKDPEECGLLLLGVVDGYPVYQDMVETERQKQGV